MKYKVKVYLGADLGWLYIVGKDINEPMLYSLEQAIDVAKQYTHGTKNYVEIIDEEGNEYVPHY